MQGSRSHGAVGNLIGVRADSARVPLKYSDANLSSVLSHSKILEISGKFSRISCDRVHRGWSPYVVEKSGMLISRGRGTRVLVATPVSESHPGVGVGPL